MSWNPVKSIRKAVKSVGKALRGAIKSVATPVAGLLGAKPQDPQDVAPPPPPAAQVAPPISGEVEKEITEDTESERKKAASRGKRSLQVTRTSGQGINI
ncbi:host range protein [Pasteurella phage vB_PmuP_PHB02]|uniref:Host range protein n=1 Tax=Pasteurella phage vB_PmuP_PHB02 TaxID=2005054 RepID=A0A1Y0SVM3_9CAUD|nr:host range protein [Pasteurella phage vB_PmuP_PHB02]ARV77581.1 host range protein [Pasteurella phage vB_PmuP_PHB02]